MNRRQFLYKLTALSALSYSHIITPETLEETPREKLLKEYLSQSPGTLPIAKQTKLALPKQSDYGLAVPVRVDASKRKGITEIGIFVEQNDNPMAINVQFFKKSIPYISTRINIKKTSKVSAILRTSAGLEEIQTFVTILS